MPKGSSHFICLPMILIESVLKKDENYNLQVFLKECNYTIKETKDEKIC